MGTFIKDEPVYRGDDHLWYFLDETWAHVHGPYQTEKEAFKAFYQYADNLNRGSFDVV